MKPALFLFLFLYIFVSCKFQDNENKTEQSISISLSQALTGEWRSTIMYVKIYSAGGKIDSSASIIVEDGKWDSVMQFKPIRTHFLPASKGTQGGGYYSDYIALDDSFMFRKTGSWLVKDDSLTLFEDGKNYKYLIQISENTATFRSIMDWDNDGQEDDEYFGVQRKFIKSR